MLKRALTAGAAVLAVAACAETTTDPTGPIQAAVAKVPLCHWDAATGQFSLIMVPSSGKPYQKHLAHGDGEPGGAVPGTPGYVFDDNCLQVASERVFAIAYTDVDPNDGPGFKDGTDVLIAKLVDANNDGVVSAGDLVVMGVYPKDLGVAEYGNFSVTGHTLTEVVRAEAGVIVVLVGTGQINITSYQYQGAFEAYAEFDHQGTNVLAITDIRDMAYWDGVFTIAGVDPSQPDATISVGQQSPVDDGFIDVEINLGGL